MFFFCSASGTLPIAGGSRVKKVEGEESPSALLFYS